MVSFTMILLLNINGLFFGFPICDEAQWKVTGNSRLEILGSTNVNEFQCLSVDYEGEDIMKEVCNKMSDDPLLNGEIVMKSTGFDCHNSMMTKDFAKTVQADLFPEIKIKFKGLTEHVDNKDESELNGDVLITLAGNSKLYQVTCIVKEENERRKHLEGKLSIHFSDFDLQAPEKLFGTIKVSDALNVQFHLKLEKI